MTLYVPDIQEHYHSIHGAVRESRHVFIQAGLLHSKLKQIRIFEMGFGTGLNALLTLLEAKKKNITIQYDTIDIFPLSINIIQKLNYPELLTSESRDLFKTIHSKQWNETHQITSFFHLTKMNANLQTHDTGTRYDLVYFDAFNPRVQPELWSPGVFKKLFNFMNPGGILTTYSATGWVRRNMLGAGFKVEKYPGPPGKRDMLRATKPGVG